VSFARTRLRLPRPGAGTYAWAVAAAGALALVLLLARRGTGDLTGGAAPLVLLAGAVAGEVWPIHVPRRDHDGVFSTSGPFVLALLISSGLPEAVIAQVLATLVADLADRRGLTKAAFNAGQSVLTVLAAGAVLAALSGVPTGGDVPFAPADLGAIAAAALTYTLVNNTLVSVVIALDTGSPVFTHLRYDFVFQTAVNAMLLCLAPVVVLVVGFSPLLVPALAVPVLAVHAGSRQAVLTEHQALHDQLTGLPNRVLLRDRCERALALTRPEGRRVGLLVMDLDGFKEVNDALGHAYGDRLLELVGARLVRVIKPGETVARLGGDEFAVLLPDLVAPAEAEWRADELLRALEPPCELLGLRLDVRGSIGLAVHPDHGDDVDELLSRADLAMYAAKETGTGREVYDARRDVASAERLTLMGDLRRGLRGDELLLHYHPKVELATGRVAGVEALVRWRHPERGIVPPLDFVPYAEQTGLIAPLTDRVLELALSQCAAWRAEGLELRVAVNVSARNLLDGQLPGTVERLLRRTGVPPGWLELEITESAVMTDPVRAEGVLQSLAGLGVGLSIDDFGTGYSSLAYLSRLPVDEMKIDRAFVARIEEDGRDLAIVESSIALARRLGMRAVAEGVESEGMRRRLIAAGCDLAQGFFFAKPLAAADLVAWLSARAESTREAPGPLLGSAPR
jgi:diguanylate cyclase (GGDEF)-like protein